MAAAGLLAYGVFTRMKPPPAASAPTGAGFGDLKLDLPDGCAIRSAAVSGETIVIHAQGIESPGAHPACDRVFVVRAADGRLLGTIEPGRRRP